MVSLSAPSLERSNLCWTVFFPKVLSPMISARSRSWSVAATTSEAEALPLIEVRPATAGGEAFELELGGGKRLRIPVAFEVEALERLLAVLARSV